MSNNNDAGTFVLNTAENGRPNIDPKQYGKQLYNTSSEPQFDMSDRRDTQGKVVIRDGKMISSSGQGDAGTYHLNMEARANITPGAHYDPNDRVNYGGTQITAKVAANMGLLVDNGNGGYTSPFDRGSNMRNQAPRPHAPSTRSPQGETEDPYQRAYNMRPDVVAAREAAARENNEQGPTKNNDSNTEAMESMAPEVERKFTTAVGHLSPETQSQIVSELAGGKGITEEIVAQFAKEARIGIEGAELIAKDLHGHFVKQAMDTVETWGFNPESFFDYAWDNYPDLMGKAIETHGFNRSTQGYKEVAYQLLTDVAKEDPNQILNANFGPGYSARQVNGKIVITTPKGEMTWEAYVRHGNLKVNWMK